MDPLHARPGCSAAAAPPEELCEFQATTPGSDVQLLFDRFITVTPLKYDMTDHETMKMWAGQLEK